MEEQKCLAAYKPTKTRAIFGSGMRPLFAILSLLFCLIAMRADQLPVIQDSEAIHYIGKNVEVRGFVVSVTTSPLGTAFINFWARVPQSDFRWVYCGRFKNCD
jgi:hypothetical protein